MSNIVEIKVPDIGDFKEVEVIEVLVAAGDTIKAEQSLITVESDKASMEIPASSAGVVKSVKVKVGDKVAEGTVILDVEAAGEAAAAPRPRRPRPSAEGGCTEARAPRRARRPRPPTAARPTSNATCWCWARPRRLFGRLPRRRPGHGHRDGRALRHPGRRVPERGLHSLQGAAAQRRGDRRSARAGRPWHQLRRAQGRPGQAARLQGQRGRQADRRPGRHGPRAQGARGHRHGRVRRPAPPHGDDGEGKKQTIRFKQAIIAAGSQSVKLPFLPDDERIVDSTGALQLRAIPKKMLIVGGGIIGLEMGTVYSTLGARLDVVEMLDGLMQGADRDLVKVWQKMNAPRFDNIMLKTKTVGAEARKDGIYVSFEGGRAQGAAALRPGAAGRGPQPNGKKIGAERAGVAVTERGFIEVDRQMRTNVPHIYAIGDVVGQPMLAHKAVHEGHVAAEAAMARSRTSTRASFRRWPTPIRKWPGWA
ncbi:dihydrolipoyl dehydrogenase [Bordetella pertussis 18323]|nr:dihydrolipoyl dehydrogenase [Bordetella pertussis 18323]